MVVIVMRERVRRYYIATMESSPALVSDELYSIGRRWCAYAEINTARSRCGALLVAMKLCILKDEHALEHLKYHIIYHK